ncbi:MAG TPA: 2Fe-2S iron-sulfur cluster-binding protein [Anaeromyxobacteraceae bacterium]|nr:2Fe-2S iron-sulfur cluster-binding protein [Anaeromyxobacteraceae bacterium]
MPRLPGFPTDCTITFDGDPVPARAGESVASALLAAGRPLLSRSAKYHRPRGPFCLSGSCGSCLVRVDGAPSVRACATPCREGLAVETQNAFPSAEHDLLGGIDALYARGLDAHHLMTWNALANRAAVALSRRLAGVGRLPEAPPPSAAPAPPAEERFDALVVGAGPAGLGAAEALSRAGRRILLAEAEPLPGGRLRARLGPAGDPDLAWADQVAASVRSAGGEVAVGATVLALWIDRGEPLAGIRTGGPAPVRLVRAGRIILCPGGHPQPPAIPGGDRPGVLAARGLAAALREHGVLPGRRIAVLGDGPEAEALAGRLRVAGAEVLAAPAAARLLGRSRVRGLVLPDGRRIACEAVAVAAPPAPATDLARHLGAEVVLDPILAAFAVRVSASGATSVPGLLAAGEATGPMGAAGARESGRRAGEEAARG